MRESAYIKLNRKLVRKTDLTAAAYADCMRNRIATHLSLDEPNEKYFTIYKGLAFVRLTADFVINWLPVSRSAAFKASERLIASKVIVKRVANKRAGAWFAFTPSFIDESTDFFDSSIKKQLLCIAREAEEGESGNASGASSNASGGSGNASLGSKKKESAKDKNFASLGSNNASSGSKPFASLGSNNASLGSNNASSGSKDAIYNNTNNTKPTNTREKPNTLAQQVGRVSSFGFLGDSEKHLTKTAARLLKTYKDPAKMAGAHLEFNPNKNLSNSLTAIHSQFGAEIYAAAIAIAGVDHKDGRLDSFLVAVCRRLTFQFEAAMKRAAAKSRRTANSIAPTPAYQQVDNDYVPSNDKLEYFFSPEMQERLKAKFEG